MGKNRVSCRFRYIVLLLAICYAANWTDDNYSYWVAARWRAFRSANGAPQSLSGGGGALDATRMMMASAAWKLNKDSNPQSNSAVNQTSVIESVFGQPLGASSSADNAGSADTMSMARRGFSSAGGGFGSSGMSLSQPMGSRGASSFGGTGFNGQSGYSGMSLGGGLAGMSIPH